MNQQEYFGVGSIENLKDILPKLNTKNIFLLTGKNSYASSGAANIMRELLKEYSVSYFNEFSENPKLEDVIKGMDLLIESDCDTVIAIGGGSVIDMGKCTNILSAQNDHPSMIIEGKAKIINKGKPFIAVPTTSGAGSESTHFAVVYIKKEKYSLANDYVLPDYAIIDPGLTYNLPSHITAISGMDAFSQAIESYWNVNLNDESKGYSSEAITLILNNLHQAVNDPTKESRVNMSKAAHLAGKAINITKTTAPHAVSYSLTSYFGVPHGQAVSITLGEFLEFNLNVNSEDVNAQISLIETKRNMDNLTKLLGCREAADGKAKIDNLMKSIGLKTKLSELNIRDEEDINLILNNVNLERLKNNPRMVSPVDLKNILTNIT